LLHFLSFNDISPDQHETAFDSDGKRNGSDLTSHTNQERDHQNVAVVQHIVLILEIVVLEVDEQEVIQLHTVSLSRQCFEEFVAHDVTQDVEVTPQTREQRHTQAEHEGGPGECVLETADPVWPSHNISCHLLLRVH